LKIVIKDENNVDLTEAFIENYVNERVSYMKQIRGGVHFLKEFPVTPTKKVKNRELSCRKKWLKKFIKRKINEINLKVLNLFLIAITTC
jgi:hypothetical protein